ncbi:hypothetical protein Tco_0254899 [Tanacetum coccineum]
MKSPQPIGDTVAVVQVQMSKSANVNGEASTSQPKENKDLSASQPNNKVILRKSKMFLLEGNGKPMDDLVDDARNKVEAPPKKTPYENCRLRKWSIKISITQMVDGLRMVIRIPAGGKDRPIILAPGNYFKATDADTTPATPEDIQKWITAKAEAVQIILTGTDNDIYLTVDACPNAIEMWKAIKRLKQDPEVVADDKSSSKEKEIDKLMALISMSFKKIYKPTNNNLRTSSNTRNMNVDNTPRTNRGTRDDTDDEPEDQELEAHYMYMAKIQEVIPDVADNSGPIFDDEPLQKVHDTDDDYNVFANERQHLEQPESVNDTYLVKQGDNNIASDSSDMSNNGEKADQDDQILQKERELFASLIEKMKIQIARSKQNNKALESSNKNLREENTFLHIKLKREYYYADYMNAILGVDTTLDEHSDLACNYLEALENVNVLKMSFQKEQKMSTTIHSMNYLKAQLQDKNIAISELKKLIEKMKGKSVDTKSVKSLVVEQPNAFKSKKQSVLGKPTPFLDSLERKDFSKSKLGTKTTVLKDLSNQSLHRFCLKK